MEIMKRSSYVRGLTRFDKGDLSGAVADFNQGIQSQSATNPTHSI